MAGRGNPSLVPRPHVQAGYETKLKPVNHVPRRSSFGGVAGSRLFCKTDVSWFVPERYLAAVTFAMDRFSTSLLLVLALASTGMTNSSEFLLLVVPCLAWCVTSPWLVSFNAKLNKFQTHLFTVVEATLRFANYYGDHMVLQRAPHSANVWGFLPACDDSVEVMFGGKMYTATLNPGEWY